MDLIKIEECDDIVCYPKHRANEKECRNRINELKSHGVKFIINFGRIKIDNIYVLGKGFSSVILLTSYGDLPAVIKVRRFDSRRHSLMDECKILSKASLYGVAPYVYLCHKDFIVMEYIHGLHLIEYIRQEINKDTLRRVILELISKAFILDLIGIDHGELSRPWKHVLISHKGVFIIDFESASMSRRPHNVPCLVNALILNPKSPLYEIFSSLRQVERKNIIDLLSLYKKSINYKVFKQLFELLYQYLQ